MDKNLYSMDFGTQCIWAKPSCLMTRLLLLLLLCPYVWLLVQFLAAETDAVVLRPTEVPIIQYSVQFWKGLPHRGSIEVAGPQGSIGTVAQYQPIIDSSCESLMANASVLARVEVRVQVHSRIEAFPVCCACKRQLPLFNSVLPRDAQCLCLNVLQNRRLC